jgi:hypothetical protein
MASHVPACGAALAGLLAIAAAFAAPVVIAGHKSFMMDIHPIANENLKAWNGNRAVQARPADVWESVNAT